MDTDSHRKLGRLLTITRVSQITLGGTIAQPAYDARAHYRQFDALLLTDNSQNIIDLGYLKHEPGE